MISLVMGVLASAACGGGSSEEAFSSFLGTWKLESTSTFTVTCPGQTPLTDASIWDELVFDPGTVSDIIEITGGSRDITGNLCRFGYNVKGQTASITAIDGLTNAAPSCEFVLQVQNDPMTGNVTEVDSVQIAPTPAQWSLALQPAVKNAPPHAILNGAAQWTEKHLTVAGTTALPACTYVVLANLTKVAKH
jgi:hypothetical protein